MESKEPQQNTTQHFDPLTLLLVGGVIVGGGLSWSFLMVVPPVTDSRPLSISLPVQRPPENPTTLGSARGGSEGLRDAVGAGTGQESLPQDDGSSGLDLIVTEGQKPENEQANAPSFPPAPDYQFQESPSNPRDSTTASNKSKLYARKDQQPGDKSKLYGQAAGAFFSAGGSGGGFGGGYRPATGGAEQRAEQPTAAASGIAPGSAQVAAKLSRGRFTYRRGSRGFGGASQTTKSGSQVVSPAGYGVQDPVRGTAAAQTARLGSGDIAGGGLSSGGLGLTPTPPTPNQPANPNQPRETLGGYFQASSPSTPTIAGTGFVCANQDTDELRNVKIVSTATVTGNGCRLGIVAMIMVSTRTFSANNLACFCQLGDPAIDRGTAGLGCMGRGPATSLGGTGTTLAMLIHPASSDEPRAPYPGGSLACADAGRDER